MSKIKIVQEGWETYTGLLGNVEFTDGESVDVVSERDGQRLGGLINMVRIDSGRSPSIAQVILDSRAFEAEMQAEVEVATPIAAAPVEAVIYTREHLEALADSQGIKALREIGEPLGLRSTSIAELIQKILDAQAPAAEPAPEVVAEVAAEPVAEAAPEVAAEPAAEVAPEAQPE